MMRLPFGILRRRTHPREADYFDLDRIAGRALRDYADAVDAAASRHELATILTGLAGCELAMHRAEPLMAWSLGDDDGDSPEMGESQTVAAEMRDSGLLLLEVASCALQGNNWQRPALWHGTNPALHDALANLAAAYGQCDKPGDMTGDVDVDIAWALHALCDIQPAESLAALMRTHGHSYFENRVAAAGRQALPEWLQDRNIGTQSESSNTVLDFHQTGEDTN